MQRTDCARQLPPDVWECLAPLRPAVVWGGTGHPPASNDAC
jgi:hypothetical protein